MRKLLAIFLSVAFLCGCQPNAVEEESNTEEETKEEVAVEEEPVVEEDDGFLDQKLRISVNGQETILKLYDGDIGRQIIAQMPLTCEWVDYNNVEKASSANNFVDVGDTPRGAQPAPGDVVVYIPWGNFTVFYGDYHYDDNLIKIGEVESGLEAMSSISGNFTATVDVIE